MKLQFIMLLMVVISLSAICDDKVDPIQVITQGYELGIEARSNAISKLSNSLSQEEFDSLFAFLYQTTDSGIEGDVQFCTLKNNVLAKMCTQQPYNDILITELIKMYKMPSLGECWQNYTIQYLSSLHTHATADNKQRIISFYQNTLKNPKNIGLGTILIALKNIVQDTNNKKLAKQTAESAYKIYKTPKISDVDELTSFQVMTALKHPETQKTAQSILKTSKNINLKVCAIYALKQINDPTDAPLLKSLSSSPDPRIQSALK